MWKKYKNYMEPRLLRNKSYISLDPQLFVPGDKNLLDLIPVDMLLIIAEYMDIFSLLWFRSTNKRYYRLTQKIFDRPIGRGTVGP